MHHRSSRSIANVSSHLVLRPGLRAAERGDRGVERVAGGPVQPVQRGRLGRERLEQLARGLLVGGDALQQRDALAAAPEEDRAAVALERLDVLVGARPTRPRAATAPARRRSRAIRSCACATRDRADVVLPRTTRCSSVQTSTLAHASRSRASRRARIAGAFGIEHLEPELAQPARARASSITARISASPSPLPRCGGGDADAADPAAVAADRRACRSRPAPRRRATTRDASRSSSNVVDHEPERRLVERRRA